MSDPHEQLRVGNAERSAAVAELQQAAVDGKLTPDELTERSALAQAARTYADLDACWATFVRRRLRFSCSRYRVTRSRATGVRPTPPPARLVAP
ncbi:MAG: DUF1707 domain-containing protein [Micropruina glycogenica]